MINLLQLQPLPEEGGYFRRTYLNDVVVTKDVLPERYGRSLPASSAIYYLLTTDNFSAMHRLESDELYHFYYGDPVDLLLLHPEGDGEVVTLGTQFEMDMRPQHLVKHGVWQGSTLNAQQTVGYALIGTTVTPAYDDAGFELGSRQQLQAAYPAWADAITQRSRTTDN